MKLHVTQLVISLVVFLNSQENLARHDLIMKRIELVQFLLNKIQQTLIRVKMNRMNLNLHRKLKCCGHSVGLTFSGLS